MQIMTNTEEFKIFYELAVVLPKGQMIIGKGEAAALALSKVHGGIIASNNLKDISTYIKLYKQNHITTCDILVQALKQGMIDETIGNQIWSSMIQKRRLLPTPTFTDYLISI